MRFAHVMLRVKDLDKSVYFCGVVTREVGPVKGGTQIIAFIKDPGGYQIELIEKA